MWPIKHEHQRPSAARLALKLVWPLYDVRHACEFVGKISKLLFNTGARASLLPDNEYRCGPSMINLSAGTAKDTFKVIRAEHLIDELREEFAGMNMAEIMQDQLMKENTSVIAGTRNKLGKGDKKMTRPTHRHSIGRGMALIYLRIAAIC